MNTQGSVPAATFQLDELPTEERGFVLFTVNGHTYLLCKHNGQFFALRDWCPHEGKSFIDKDKERNNDILRIGGNCIACPIHKAVFDLRTGAVVRDPPGCNIQLKLERLIVKDQGGYIELLFPECEDAITS
jgi:nitrite reductase/ring-hydroxylating ferredoxin subunit